MTKTKQLRFLRPGDPLPTDPEPCPDCGRRETVCSACQLDIETAVAAVEARLRPLPAHLLSAVRDAPLRRLPRGKD